MTEPSLRRRQVEFTEHLVHGFPEFNLSGLPLKSAAAITGNATVENNCLPVTVGKKDHGSDGTLQWRLDRLDGHNGLKSWSGARGLPWDELRTQAAFCLWEMATFRNLAWINQDLRSAAKPLKTHVANFSKFYERPNKAYEHLDERIKAAEEIYEYMKIAADKRDDDETLVEATTRQPGAIVITPNAVTSSPFTSVIGLLCLTIGAITYFGIPIFGIKHTWTLAFGVLSAIVGLGFLKSKDHARADEASPARLDAIERKVSAVSLQIDELKRILVDTIAFVRTLSDSHSTMADKLKAGQGAIHDIAELPALVAELKQVIDAARARFDENKQQ